VTAFDEQALRLKPGLFRAQGDLGMCLRPAGRYQDAILHYREAVRVNPDYAEAHNNLGSVLMRLGKPDEAIGHIQQSLQIKPEIAEAHYNLGSALAQVNKPARRSVSAGAASQAQLSRCASSLGAGRWFPKSEGALMRRGLFRYPLEQVAGHCSAALLGCQSCQVIWVHPRHLKVSSFAPPINFSRWRIRFPRRAKTMGLRVNVAEPRSPSVHWAEQEQFVDRQDSLPGVTLETRSGCFR
jgi:hypothetical protein